jgi:type I restriction enzyme S subunit
MINVKCIRDGYLDLSETKFVSWEKINRDWKHFLIEENDILVSTSGTIGRVAKVRKEELPILMNTSVVRFRSLDEDKLDNDYLKFFLMSKFFFRQLENQATQMCVKNVGPTHIKKTKLILPPLKEQKRIIEVLEKADFSRKIRQEADAQSDKIAYTLLFGMFGDPIRNPKNLTVSKLGDICEFTQGVQIPRSEQINEEKAGYIRYLYIRDFFTDKFKCYVKNQYHHKIMQKDDIMMVNTGATAGNVYMGAYGVLSNNAFKISYDKEVINNIYFYYYLSSPYFQEMVRKFFNPAGQPHMGHKNIARMKIVIPKLSKQQKFADLVQKVEKIKEKQQESKEELDNLFNSLMQKHFS